MSKKYIYDGRDLFEILGKKSDKEITDKVNQCLIAGRKITLSNSQNERHQTRIKHFNKVIKALPEEKLSEYIKAFLLMD